LFANWEYLEILRRQRSFVAIFTGSAMLTALLLTYAFSEKYEAATAVFYRPQEITRLKAQQPQAFGSPVPAPPFKVIGKTIEEMILSEIVLGHVVDRLNLDEDNKVYEGPWYSRFYEMTKDFVKEQGENIWTILKYGRLIEAEPRQSAIRGLRKNIKIKSEDSYVFYLIVRDKYPERAAAIVDAVADELVNWLRYKEQDPMSFRRQRLEQVLSDKDQQIADYRAKILELLNNNGTSSVAYELQEGNERLSQLELERISTLSLLSNYQSELVAIGEKLKQKNNPRQRDIQVEDFRRLVSQEISMQIEIQGAQAKYDAIEEEIGKLQVRLQQLSAAEIALKALSTNLETVSRDYVLINDALQEVIVRESSIDSEVGILHNAVVPSTPISPVKIYHAGLAGVLGAMFSIGLVYLLTYFNLRILFPSLGVKGRRRSAVSGQPDQKENQRRVQEQAV
jgi:uncharacterized protein involved in exopolysaccharide biosynthesis